MKKADSEGGSFYVCLFSSSVLMTTVNLIALSTKM